ncbi:MAG: hypothetical protein AAGA54_08365 [Myxococcota bacterium]
MERRAGWIVVCGLLACAAEERDDGQGTFSSGLPPASGANGTVGGSDGGEVGDDGDETGSDGGGEKFDVGAGDSGPDSADSGDGVDCPCENVLDGIYVLNTNSPPSVWFFDPPANTFTEVGVLGCSPPLGYTANSMAIDREGYAWINYYDVNAETGKMYRAPLSDLSACEDRGYTNTPGDWWLFGMGYATVSAGSSCDELFIYKSDRYLEYPNFSPGGAQLAQYDQVSDSLSVLGNTDYPVGELTGTGNGQLFAFGPVDASQAVLVELDKDTGAELENIPLPGLDITNAFAFGFWGGDVYFFTETFPNSGTSQVTRLDYDGNDGGGFSTYNASAGIHIAGAGVSTCASFTPPG